MTTGFLLASVFLACLVESVEALTIVLAAGISRGWRSALQGVAAALVVLAVVVAVLGPALTVVPLRALRVVVGALLLVYGLQWIRKAVLRAAGWKALHDEGALFAEHRSTAEGAPAGLGPQRPGRRRVADWYGFVLAFKGVLLEGLEVVFIVLTFGANAHRTGLAALAAGAAALVVLVAGLAARAPLTRVPENAMKMVVGVLLTTFGLFWAAEGTGVDWPGGELALLPLLALSAGVAGAATVWAAGRRSGPARRVRGRAARGAA